MRADDPKGAGLERARIASSVDRSSCVDGLSVRLRFSISRYPEAVFKLSAPGCLDTSTCGFPPDTGRAACFGAGLLQDRKRRFLKTGDQRGWIYIHYGSCHSVDHGSRRGEKIRNVGDAAFEQQVIDSRVGQLVVGPAADRPGTKFGGHLRRQDPADGAGRQDIGIRG